MVAKRSIDRPFVAIVVAAMLVRLVWVVRYTRQPAFAEGGDPGAYLYYARSLVNGRGYVSVVTGKETAFQPPGWSLLMTVAFWFVDRLHLPGSDPMIAALLNVGFGTGTVALTMAIARRAASRRVALIAGGVVALWPNLVFYTPSAALETFFTFLVLLLCWMIVRLDWPRSRLHARHIIAIGLVLGVTVLVRPFALVVLVAMPLTAWFVGTRGDRRRSMIEVAAVAALSVAVLVPWTIRNAMQMHGFVVIATNLGETLCLGHQPGASGGYGPDTDYCVHGFQSNQLAHPHDEVLRNAHAMRAALHHITSAPLDDIGLLPKKLYYLMRSDHDGLTSTSSNDVYSLYTGQYRRLLSDGADAWFFGVWILALGAARRVWRHRRDAVVLLLAFTAAGLLTIPLGLYGLERFHLPLAPFAAMAAAVTISGITAHAGRGRREWSP